MNVTITPLNDNEIPTVDMSDNPTGCCPRFYPEQWDGRILRLRDMPFVKARTRSFLHFPLNIGSVFKKTFKSIEEANAQNPESFLVLSRDVSPWTGEHLFAVTTDVPNQEMVRLTGNYRAKVFEGPYKNAPKWNDELIEMADGSTDDTFFFYTTCPRCAKAYGKNYVVGFVASQPDTHARQS